LILYNGNIITINDRQPRAEALAIAGNRFLAVAMNEKVLSPASGKTKKINLESRTVVPGFIDAHTYAAAAGLMHLRQVDCDLRSTAEIQKAILERASKTPAGQPMGRLLHREDLDAAAT
jgi:predicted amidohydrolase YtcJ